MIATQASIIKSKSDSRIYKHITLPNKLSCLLISDKEADKSAASLDVNVGCALDPKPLYGTAHFLEHMLFMGTTKYPSENEYTEYIKNNDGMNNAYTSMTNTNYHFDCSNEAFEGALDRFAQFFICPLLSESSTEREMKAVDSEYKQSIQHDGWRFMSIVQTESHPDSAFHRFNCGNMESLKQPGIREALLDFHKRWYSSNIMKLCVLGNHDIATLEDMTASLFSKVQNKEVIVPSYAYPPAFDHRNLGQFYKIVPVKDRDILSFSWHLPYSELEHKTQPLRYHSHLFGYEGENSLLSYLISEGLALELTAQHDHSLQSWSNFDVDVILTKKGLQEYERVVEAVFKFAKIIKERGVQEYIFEENKIIGQIEFDFADKGSPVNHTVKLASKLQIFDHHDKLEDIIKHSYVVDYLDKQRIQEMSDHIADSTHLNIYLRSKSFEKECNKQDKWYGAKYSNTKFTERLQDLMKSPNPVIRTKKLDLPPRNILLPKNLDLLPQIEEHSKRPMLLQQWDDADLWYMKDDKFKMPKAIVNMKFYTNDCAFGRTARARVFIEVWNSMLQEYLREFYYMAACASLHADMSVPIDNYNIQWSGFNDSLPVFIDETVKKMKEFKVDQHKEMFDQCKERLLQNWKNFYLEQSYKQAFLQFDTLMVTGNFERKVMREELEKYNFEDILTDSQNWLQQARYLFFIHGNLSKENAIDIVEKARKSLGMKSINREELQDVRCIALQNGHNYLLERQLEDPANDNNCVITYYECGLEGFDIRTRMIHSVVMQYLDEPTFNQLRTQEQLGYVVFSRMCDTRDVLGAQFIVQSPKESSEYIVNSINNFLIGQKDKVSNISQEEFEQHVEAVMIKIQEKDYNLYSENSRFWSEIATHKYIFDRQQRSIDLLKSLTKEEFIQHFERVFFSPQSKRLDFELNSQHHKEKQEEWKVKNGDSYFKDKIRVEVKENFSQFKKKMGLHPDTFKANYASFKL